MDCIIRILWVLIIQGILILFYVSKLLIGIEIVAFAGWLVFCFVILFDLIVEYFARRYPTVLSQYREFKPSHKVRFVIDILLLILGGLVVYAGYLMPKFQDMLGVVSFGFATIILAGSQIADIFSEVNFEKLFDHYSNLEEEIHDIKRLIIEKYEE